MFVLLVNVFEETAAERFIKLVYLSSLSADLACVKTEVLEAKIRKTDLEEKCRKHEGTYTLHHVTFTLLAAIG